MTHSVKDPLSFYSSVALMHLTFCRFEKKEPHDSFALENFSCVAAIGWWLVMFRVMASLIVVEKREMFEFGSL